MYWPDPGWKEKKSYLLYFQNRSPCHFQILGRATRFGMASHWYGFSGSWDGLRCWWLSQIVQEDHSGHRLVSRLIQHDRWQGYWSDPAPNHRQKLSHKELAWKRLQFSDFKFKIKVCHLCEMDVVEAEMTKWVTPNLWKLVSGRRGMRHDKWGCTGHLFVCGWTMSAVRMTWHVQDLQKSSSRIAPRSSW